MVRLGMVQTDVGILCGPLENGPVCFFFFSLFSWIFGDQQGNGPLFLRDFKWFTRIWFSLM